MQKEWWMEENITISQQVEPGTLERRLILLTRTDHDFFSSSFSPRKFCLLLTRPRLCKPRHNFEQHLLTKETLYQKKVSNIVPHTVGKLRLSAFQWCVSWIRLFESVSRNKHICMVNHQNFSALCSSFWGKHAISQNIWSLEDTSIKGDMLKCKFVPYMARYIQLRWQNTKMKHLWGQKWDGVVLQMVKIASHYKLSQIGFFSMKSCFYCIRWSHRT